MEYKDLRGFYDIRETPVLSTELKQKHRVSVSVVIECISPKRPEL